jgi:pyruvate formate lyase activating enzyme
MEIIDFEKISLQDYPDVISSIGYTRGCPLRCPYCHNPSLVLPKLFDEDIQNQHGKFMDHLEKRKTMLEGVVISGGEPLIQNGIAKLLEEIKALGLSIKIDTNGMYPIKLEELLVKGLVDYVALDYKGYKESFYRAIGINPDGMNHPPYEEWKKTLNVIEHSGVSYELRSTIVKEIHPLDQITGMGKELNRLLSGVKPNWYLQTYERAEGVLNEITLAEPKISSYSKEEMEEITKKLGVIFPNIKLR